MASLISALSHVFLPLTIIIGITGVFGLLGNGLAFYIFSFRFPSGGFNTLMAALAAYDFIACLIHMPLDIATFFEIGASRVYLCKITCFQLAFTATGSAAVLVAIAVVRFYGIRKPLGGILSLKLAYYILLASTILAIGISLPITILFGSGDLQTDDNVTAEICAVERKYRNTLGPLLYYMILASLYIVSFVLNTFLYTQSVITVWSRRRVFVSMRGKSNVVMLSPATRRSNPLPPIPPPIPSTPPRSPNRGNRALNRRRADSGSSTVPLCPRGRNGPMSSASASISPGVDVIPENDYHDMDYSESDNIEVDASSSTLTTVRNGEPSSTTVLEDRTDSPLDIHLAENNSSAILCPNNDNDSNTTTPSPSPRPSDRTPRTNASSSDKPSRGDEGGGANKGTGSVNQTSYRVLGVVIAISLTYFLSYAPHFGVMFYLFTHDETVFRASAQNLAFELFMRSFFINNVLDPVIYGLLSRDFRREIRVIFSSLTSFCFRPKLPW